MIISINICQRKKGRIKHANELNISEVFGIIPILGNPFVKHNELARSDNEQKRFLDHC